MQADKSNTHISKRGLRLPMNGEPDQRVDAAPAISKVAVLADDSVGMRPRMRVQVGDAVKRGDPLFEDRKSPGVLFTSPGAGTIGAIHRGVQRALRSVVIELDESDSPKELEYETYRGKDPTSLSSDEVRAALIESGLWTSLRQRPFGKVPPVDGFPRSIFVTAMDSNPLAPDPEVVLSGNEADFETGISILTQLPVGGKVYLCKKAGSSISAGSAGGVEVHDFDGPHPAGTAGFHIHTIEPADRERIMWHVGYQDVVAMGHFFRTGHLLVDRVVALCGPSVNKPRLVKTRVGAALESILAGETTGNNFRILSGSVWNGRKAEGEAEGFLGRYHNQITVLKEGNRRRFMGWLAPGFDKFSLLNLFASKMTPGKMFDFDTDLNGGCRGIVPTGSVEKVMPFDLMPAFLLRAIIAGDMEMAEELGVLELDEEDVALCTFACPSKNEYGIALRDMLTRIEKEG